MMNSKNIFKLFAATILLITLNACEHQGPAEELGEDIDNTAEEIGQNVDQSAEEFSDDIEETVQ